MIHWVCEISAPKDNKYLPHCLVITMSKNALLVD